MKSRNIFSFLLVLAFVFLSSHSMIRVKRNPVSSLPATVVLYWNEKAYEAFGGVQYQHSLAASRLNAMVQLAIHDALNGIEERYQRYAFNGHNRTANPVAAVSAAAYEVLLHELPDRRSFLDSALKESLAGLKANKSLSDGIVLGRQAAKAVLEKRNNDGSVADPIVAVPVSNVPGVYQAVPPFQFKFATHWEHVKPFSIGQKDQFRPAPHPGLQSEAYTEAFQEVKKVGSLRSTARTAEQTAYARFWYEFSEAGWNRVARTVIKDRHLNMLEAARLLALVDMALADSYIAGWDAKIHYNFWRPLTAIRMAAADGNAMTEEDRNWEPAEVTPPIQDYPSTHSVLGNAAATVMTLLLGDQISFSMSSPTARPAGSVRYFRSLLQAADENADSRVMAGIHFRFSCDAGQKMGNEIGTWTVKHHLQPLR